jgi:hypothetical protein
MVEGIDVRIWEDLLEVKGINKSSEDGMEDG